MPKPTRPKAPKTTKTAKRPGQAKGGRGGPRSDRSVSVSERRAATPSEGPKMFVNFPVRDLKRSMEFFKEIGYTFNPQFTNDDAACMVIGKDNFAMLLTEKFFKTFTTKSIADSTKSVEALVALSCDDRHAVDDMINRALAAGGKKYREPQDQGFMYSWGFEDPDGHIWEYFWMDPAALEAPPQVKARRG